MKANTLEFINNETFSQYPTINEDELVKLEKNNLLEFLSKSVGKNITYFRQIFLKQKFRFGNQMILIYKVIFYCQILRCKKIIFQKTNNWFIKITILNKKYKMKIELAEENNIKEYDTLIDGTTNYFYYTKYIKPIYRVDLLRDEIFKNLPKVSMSYKDLYIYIRSADIFASSKPRGLYIQRPLCYYLKVINDYEFRQIHLNSRK